MLKKLKFDLADCMVLTGIGCFAFGVYQVYQPAAYLFVGFVLFKLGTAGDV